MRHGRSNADRPGREWQDGATIEADAVSWFTTDPNFWTDLVRFAAPGAVLLLVVWVLFR
jgi:hypothetical protein